MHCVNDMGDDEIPDQSLGWRSTELFPNGDLLVVLQHRKTCPIWFRTRKIDKDSRLVWANRDNAHHEVNIGEDGLIYCDWSRGTGRHAVPGLDTLKPPFLEDFVLVTSSDGRTVHRISIMEAFAGTRFESRCEQRARIRDWKGDYFHVNDIEPYDSRNPISVIQQKSGLDFHSQHGCTCDTGPDIGKDHMAAEWNLVEAT